jgi:hypothetical protein
LASYGAAPVSPPSASSEEDEDIDGLPCEFCGVLFPPQFLLQHQVFVIMVLLWVG